MAVYPRKQTVLILVVCILVVGGVSLYAYGGFSGLSGIRSQSTAYLTDVSASPAGMIPENSDWQKQFLGINATSTSLKKTAKTVPSAPPENLTATDILGRAFITKYGELKQAGLEKDAGSIEKIMGQVTAETVARLPGPKTFSPADIRLAASSTEALTIYGKAVMSIFYRYMPKQNEAEIAHQAFVDDNMEDLKKIDPVIAGYRSMQSALLATPVPVPLASYHINLIDAVSMALYNAESFRHMDTDPVRGLAAVSLELVALQNIVTALTNMNNYFLSLGLMITS